MSKRVKNFSNNIVGNVCNCGHFIHLVHNYAMFIKCFFTIVLHQPGNEINIEKSRKNDKFSVKQNIPIFQRFRLRVSNQLINPPSGLVQIIHKNKVMT